MTLLILKQWQMYYSLIVLVEVTTLPCMAKLKLVVEAHVYCRGLHICKQTLFEGVGGEMFFIKDLQLKSLENSLNN